MFQLSQLVPIARFTADPTVLAVRADGRCTNPWQDLIEAARGAGRDPLRVVGQLRHDARADGDARSGRRPVKMLHVPFTGGGPAVVALLGGQVQAMSDRALDRHPAT